MQFYIGDEESPSAWRVWIEIAGQPEKQVLEQRHPPLGGCGLKSLRQASRHRMHCHPPLGGCGLKYENVKKYGQELESPSAWRVWIEIQYDFYNSIIILVTLRLEGVD